MKNLWIYRNSVHRLSGIGHFSYSFYNNVLNHKTVTHGIVLVIYRRKTKSTHHDQELSEDCLEKSDEE